MMWREPGRQPNVNMFTSGDISKWAVEKAYGDLTTAYNGIRDIVSILDGIFEGVYSLSEVIMAGVIIADGVDGYLRKDNYFEKGKFIRVNETDVFFSYSEHEIRWEKELSGYSFEVRDNGECFAVGKGK